MLLLARSVSPSDFGFFAAPYGAITVIQVLFDFGLPTLAIAARSKRRDDSVVTAALRVNDLLASAMAAVLLGVIAALALLVDSRYLELLPLALWAAAERNADTWLGVTLADGLVVVNTVNLVIRRALGLLIFVLGTSFFTLPALLVFSAAVALSALASSFFAHRYVRPLLPAHRGGSLRSLLGASWPYWITSVATQARNLDTVLTSIFAGTMQAGYYAAASRLTGPLRLFATSLATVLLPAAARQDGSQTHRMRRVVLLVTSASGLMYGILAAACPIAVPVVLGDAYRGAIVPIMLSLAGLVFASSTALLDSVLQGIGHGRMAAHASIVTTILALLSITAGAAVFGAVGAVAASSIAYFGQAIWLWIALGRVTRR